MRQLVFFLEELSAKAMLEGFLPRVVPEHIETRFIVFEGKQDLEKNLMRKLRSYLVPDARFIIVRDQDSSDCSVVKARLTKLCAAAGRSTAIVRIACRELESWYLADFGALSRAYERPSLRREAAAARYRNPDLVEAPSKELRRLVPEYQKIEGSRRIGALLDPDNRKSSSFAHFVDAIRRTVQ